MKSATEQIFCMMEFEKSYTADQLAHHTGFSQGAVYQAMKELVGGGVVVDGSVKQQKGRKLKTFTSRQKCLV